MRAAEHEPPIGQFELCVLVRLRRPELSMVEAFARLSFPCLACLLACPVRLRRPPAWAVVANSESALAFFLLFEFCLILCFFFPLYPFYPHAGEGRTRKTTRQAYAYAIQIRRDVSVGIDERLFAAQLYDFADNHDIPAHVRVEVGACDARGRDRIHFRLT